MQKQVGQRQHSEHGPRSRLVIPLVTEVNGLLETAREYGSAVVLLAVLAMAGLLMHRPEKAPAPAAAAVGWESPH